MKFGFSHGKRSLSRSQQKNIVQQAQDERKHLLSVRSDFFIREAYKTLRTNVIFSLTEEKNCHVVIVTSSMQSEGKSITAMNLAISLAQTDKKVIVIDCDLRRPKLARLLGMKAPAGLSNLLLKPQLKDKAILHEETIGVDVILAGDIPPNPSELLGSLRMQHLLDELKGEYDFIILDTPPVNMVTDAVVLSPQSDGVIFVVRANQSERGAVIHAVEQLEYSKTKILGFILNGVNMEQTSYGYSKYRYKKYSRYKRYGYSGYGYGGYGYGYGYGYSQPSQSAGEAMPGNQENDQK